jgi:hypothetical protein
MEHQIVTAIKVTWQPPFCHCFFLIHISEIYTVLVQFEDTYSKYFDLKMLSLTRHVM